MIKSFYQWTSFIPPHNLSTTHSMVYIQIARFIVTNRLQNNQEPFFRTSRAVLVVWMLEVFLCLNFYPCDIYFDVLFMNFYFSDLLLSGFAHWRFYSPSHLSCPRLILHFQKLGLFLLGRPVYHLILTLDGQCLHSVGYYTLWGTSWFTQVFFSSK